MKPSEQRDTGRQSSDQLGALEKLAYSDCQRNPNLFHMSSLNINGRRCAGIWPNEEVSYTNAAASAFLPFITVPGNLLVLIVVFKNPNGKMRTPFNWFILNLAVADLLVGALVEPLSVLVHVREGLGHPLKYHAYLRPVYFTSCTASVFSLGMLTIDRYIAITSPMKYRATLSNRRAAISSLGIWIISCGLPFLREKIGFLWYFFVFGNASVLVTFLVLVFAFVRVQRSLRAQIRELESIQSCNRESQIKNNALKNEAKITKTFLYMLIAFMFSYTPSLIMIYLMNFCTICSCQTIHWFRDLSFIFIVLNSCVNPFLYAWRLPNFKEAMKLIFKRNPTAPTTNVQEPQAMNTAAQALNMIQNEGEKKTSSTTTSTSMLTRERNSVDFEENCNDSSCANVNEVAIQVEDRL